MNGVSMAHAPCRAICWTPRWNKDCAGVGLEHLLLAADVADSVVLAFDEAHGPFRLTYRLTWDDSWRLHEAELVVTMAQATRSLTLHTDGQGQWHHGDGRAIDDSWAVWTSISGQPRLPTASHCGARRWQSVNGASSAWPGSARRS